ncbi:NADH-quinone oxidoreductase subunit 5 family protein [Halapricum hydrolyticum]|uniref:NADH-quinone oxidoreductase subunit L n=1 Tax=Halapricum hydrolyticum TaxID=2979991 RepID=A0AAE3IAQ4_9EURY|nr:NADH-quinone oxidoreductase subunit L [Halapricum hydrolyticum]MCU4726652.1 NADH-quinone oxidoreductase subunit L [Halapricum hydrolyticum]
MTSNVTVENTTAALPGLVAAGVLLGAVGVGVEGSGLATPAVLALAAIIAPLVGAALVPVTARAGDRARAWFATLVGTLTGVLTLALVPQALEATGSESVHYSVSWAAAVDVSFGLYLDILGVTMAAIAGVVGALVLLFSTRFMEREDGLTRYYALTLLFVGGMIGFGLSDSLVALYAFWEVLGLCSMGLIAFWLRDRTSTRAGMKAFVVTRFGDVGLLAGIAVLYAHTGTFSVQETIALAEAGGVPTWVLAWVGGLFVLAAVGKSAQFPLHVWLPDAMEAPTTSTALIHAACMVNAGIYLLARTRPLFESVAWWHTLVLAVGTATAFLAAVLATRENDFKRALAYCTISQLGYVFAALGLTHGLVPATAHLLSHSLFKALLFLGAGAVIYEIGGSVHKHVDMFEHRGIGSRQQMPVTNLTFLVGILALIGVPGFNGFWTKELILGTGLHGSPIEVAAGAVLAVTAVLTVVYSLRIYVLVFTGEPSTDAGRVPIRMAVPLFVLAVLTLGSWAAVPSFSQALAETVPARAVETYTLSSFVDHVVTTSTLALTGTVLVAGAVGFRYRAAIAGVTPTFVTSILDRRYGFDDLYLRSVGAYAWVASRSRRLQRGHTNSTVAAIALAFAAGLAVLVAL